MGFARVAITRISYVRSAVNWTTPRRPGGIECWMRVEFPDQDLETANVHITLRPQAVSTTAVRFLVQFDGETADLAGTEIAGNGPFSTYALGRGADTLNPDEVAATFASPEPFRQLMQSAFSSFTYSELRIGDRNADRFFPDGWLRITLIEYERQPVLVISEQT
jgi:hypothetical protein